MKITNRERIQREAILSVMSQGREEAPFFFRQEIINLGKQMMEHDLIQVQLDWLDGYVKKIVKKIKKEDKRRLKFANVKNIKQQQSEVKK